MQLWKAIEWYSKEKKSIYSCGETYDSLNWNSANKLSKPTLKDLEKAWDSYCTNIEANKYKADRAKTYMPVADQLDMIYNQGLDGWIKYIDGVKKLYPSPQPTQKLIPVNHMDVMKNQISELNTKLQKTIIDVDNQISALKASTLDVNNAIKAIHGFMLEIPNIQKSLLELKDMVQPK